jgi:hypothetical protein
MPEIGLYHYKARAYSPQLGRFLQTDPIGYGDGMNMYEYVGGDPANRRDPTGKKAWLCLRELVPPPRKSFEEEDDRVVVVSNWVWEWTCYPSNWEPSALDMAIMFFLGSSPDGWVFDGDSNWTNEFKESDLMKRARCEVAGSFGSGDVSPGTWTEARGSTFGPIETGANATGQFVGTARIEFADVGGGEVQVMVNNRTSMTSLLYGSVLPKFGLPQAPSHGRRGQEGLRPGSDIFQTMYWREPKPDGASCNK